MAFALCGCGLFQKGEKTTEPSGPAGQARRKVAVDMPWETTKARDDLNAPVLKVALLDDGADGVAVPYVYGYPLYPEGDAAQGILKLRHDNWEGASRQQTEDENGVVHVRELLPMLGCEIDGIAESETQFVPVELHCDLPSPKALGGAKRPVVGELRAGASPQQVVEEPSVKKAFYGDFHLISDGLSKGKGEGYFNTEHGQLAFGFERGKLISVSYYFDPPVKGWRNQALWAQP
jgi:hypothetical protein